MGIKHFFYWFKTIFGKHIKTLEKDEFPVNDVNIDNLMIDLNGIFHASTQKIYQYGSAQPPSQPKSFFGVKDVLVKPEMDSNKDELVFEDICKNISNIVKNVNPRKRIILCVDGTAPLSKQNQQRQRRFKTAKEREIEFDSNCLTPGTEFMDKLTKYIKIFILQQIDSMWKNLEVIFSDEKVPGEGEHKLINYIRTYGNPEDTFCIFGMDADLIMLALGTQFPKFWILRENPYNRNFYYINIGNVRIQLTEIMKWDDTKRTTKDKADDKVYDKVDDKVKDVEKSLEMNPLLFNAESSVNDFIFMCFTVGNDFLPHVPSLEIIEGGVTFMISIYKQVCELHGHLTEKKDDKILFRKNALKHFFIQISKHDQSILEKKIMGIKKKQFFPAPLLEKNSSLIKDGKSYHLDIQQYKKDYYSNFSISMISIADMKKFIHEYLHGTQWVLSYYTRGVPDWKWCFKYHYAPFASEIGEYIDSFEFSECDDSFPSSPFQQLLSVLPPKSASLIPSPICKLLTETWSPLKRFCPDHFEIDVSGKKQEWEGIVLLPMVNFDIIQTEYLKYIKQVDEKSRKRDCVGFSYLFFNDSIKKIEL